MRSLFPRLLPCLPLFLVPFSLIAAEKDTLPAVTVDWSQAALTSKATATLQVVVNPMLLRGAKLHDPAFGALKALQADYVRYVPWLPYPKQAVAELEAPTPDKTSWDFSHIDPTLEDFMAATAGHSVVMNFSTIPAWMFKTKQPVTYPADPNQVTWNYSQGTELRDSTMHEAAAYLARLLSWYEKGGFTDENGKFWKSDHHYKFAYWEVLNEIDMEHSWTPEGYTQFYDTVVIAMRKVDPEIKFVGLAVALERNPELFEYFLNPAHHQPGIPLDVISYHFYASPTLEQTPENWQYTFFDQADGFLRMARYINAIRDRLSPATKIDLDELGVILPEDGKEIGTPGYVAKNEPPVYWNLNAAMYAYLYFELAKMGVDVVGESQLVGYKSQYPSVTMIHYRTGQPTARYWVLKLIRDNFGPGDRLAATSATAWTEALAAQAFQTATGKKLLLINKRLKPLTLELPVEFAHGKVSYVAASSGNRSVGAATLADRTITLESGEVAVVQ